MKKKGWEGLNKWKSIEYFYAFMHIAVTFSSGNALSSYAQHKKKT